MAWVRVLYILQSSTLLVVWIWFLYALNYNRSLFCAETLSLGMDGLDAQTEMKPAHGQWNGMLTTAFHLDHVKRRHQTRRFSLALTATQRLSGTATPAMATLR